MPWPEVSLRYWFPEVRRLRIPHPKTRIVPIGKWWWLPLDGKPLPEKPIANLRQIADSQTYPLFLRTDILSGKHRWEKTCYVRRSEDVLAHATNLFEDHLMAMGIPDPTALVFREFLHLDYRFKAFLGMPVACEWRIFSTEGVIDCEHFYWPEDVFEHRHHKPALPENWRELRAELAALSLPDKCRGWAAHMTRRLGGSWSVDVARSRIGEWYLIDMAPAARSWHPEH